jgi:hypothetical protein
VAVEVVEVETMLVQALALAELQAEVAEALGCASLLQVLLVVLQAQGQMPIPMAEVEAAVGMLEPTVLMIMLLVVQAVMLWVGRY